MTHGSRNEGRLDYRLTGLARVTAELIRAASAEDVTRIVVEHSAEAVGATIASLSLREGQDVVRLMGLRGGLDGDAEAFATYPLATATPAADVIRSGCRLILAGRAEILDAYPANPSIDRGERSLLVLPLKTASETLGAIGLSFPGQREFEPAELDCLDILADTCAQGLLRIQAEQEAAERQAKLSFLAEASAELASSLDYEATLARVARLAVPTFADWCAIDLVKDNRLRRLAVAHVDPAKVAYAHEIAERYPTDPDSGSGPWQVIRTGRSELIQEITDEMLVAAARDAEHLRIARELALYSAVTVPLIARGRTLGVITWVSAESQRRYTQGDLEFAEDLARRAAVSIDNSELHSEISAVAVRLQHAVLPSALPAVEGCDVAVSYTPSGRTEVGGDFYDVIALPDGRVALFVGDVMGRGVEAAASMAQMRASVRAYLASDPLPDVVLTKLDRMLAQFGDDQFVTLAYLLVDPAGNELLVANAGHPAPVLLRADSSVEQFPGADGGPLAIGEGPRRSHRVRFDPGDTVLLFTDGLIERRTEDIDTGRGRLSAALVALADVDLHRGLQSTVTAVADETHDDDVAALALRRHRRAVAG
ncbi:GAF domain-containing SpoIIE family protein phosphatase [Pedococcus bigeumensis]|uniref:GAF domain-containing protein n=1 Tax=Pedococcus bigeumensis TaxID=433644 RepID=A0A502CT27_9MICO|nr:SpoIIE family protein phosphatase [Pedococcus bigeumensis]TPG14891.1 GAF domain-containing protein [Pedococcus bigeumensis]